MADISLDTDLASMTVAELRKALKAKGLTTTGVKQDLIDRLQLAMATDETDPNNDTDLLEDANELLGDDDDDDAPLAVVTPKPAKKVAIKRDPISAPAVTKPAEKAPEATTPTKPSSTITASKSSSADSSEEVEENGKDSAGASDKAGAKALTDAERAAARAARFGATNESAKVVPKQARAERFGLASGGASNKIGAAPSADLETLKKRAERFGQSSSNAMKKAELDEKIKKRQERFGVVEAPAVANKKMKKSEVLSSIGLNQTLKAPAPVTDEKLLKRAERFGSPAKA